MLNTIKIIRKKVKRANIKVKPNLDVILTIPLYMQKADIERILHKREAWINSKLNYFKQLPPIPTKQLVSGEDFLYLGKNYRLKVINAAQSTVHLEEQYLTIALPDTSNLEAKQQLINSWYLKQAKLCFHELLDKYQPIVAKPVNKLSIKWMQTRWGSCNPIKGYINLNLELIKKSRHAIEYVVFHELVHLIHRNHDNKFYNYISAYMPDWQLRRNALNSKNS